MEATTNISCAIGTTDPSAALGMEVWLDDNCIFNTDHVKETVKINYDFPDNEGTHLLRFIMKNKTQDHTQIDADGNIIKDARLTVSELAFEEILLNQLMFDRTLYRHDFNGSGNFIDDQFFGELGCNGVLSLEFTTPIYLWLLENM